MSSASTALRQCSARRSPDNVLMYWVNTLSRAWALTFYRGGVNVAVNALSRVLAVAFCQGCFSWYSGSSLFFDIRSVGCIIDMHTSVYLSVCARNCFCVYARMCAYTRTRTYTHTYMQIHCVCECVGDFVRLCVFVYVCVCVWERVRVWVCEFVSVYMCACVHVCKWGGA